MRDINGIEISEELLNNYIDSLVNKTFAILGIYEDCEKNNDFSTYDKYLQRMITELAGGYYVIGGETFLSLSNILTGLRHDKEVDHQKVKYLTFHCIATIKKLRIGD